MKRQAVAAALLVFLTLLSGLLPLNYIGPLPVGGLLESGQADPSRWWVGAMLATGLACAMGRSLLWGKIVSFAVLSSVSLWCWWAANNIAWQGLAQLTLLIGAMLAASGWASRRITGIGLGLMIACIAWVWMAWTDRVTEARHGPSVGVMTALPLFWAEDQGIGLVRTARRQRLIDAAPLQLRPMDHLSDPSLSGTRYLILAQPRLLQPTELVALDKWVRGGGRLLIFADPLLMWPSELSLGDPRRPPITSLLDPLFNHWGLRLEPDSMHHPVGRQRIGGKAVLLLAAPGRFVASRRSVCTDKDLGLVIRCHIGKGMAVLVADSDVLDDRLWLVRHDRPTSLAARASDAPVLLPFWLGIAEPRSAPRIIDEQRMIAGLRAALVLGLLSIVLGSGLSAVGRRGKGGENKENAE